MPLWKKAAMTLQMCQFAFYTLAFTSAAISLTLMSMGVRLYPGVALLGLVVTFLGLSSLHRLSLAGPAHAGPGA